MDPLARGRTSRVARAVRPGGSGAAAAAAVDPLRLAQPALQPPGDEALPDSDAADDPAPVPGTRSGEVVAGGTARVAFAHRDRHIARARTQPGGATFPRTGARVAALLGCRQARPGRRSLYSPMQLA
jgi:hypothetical protein